MDEENEDTDLIQKMKEKTHKNAKVQISVLPLIDEISTAEKIINPSAKTYVIRPNMKSANTSGL